MARRGEEVFALEERCPHRQASLVLGRVEDGGLRCLYHGWLMDCDGTVKETPNESDSRRPAAAQGARAGACARPAG